MSQLWRNLAPAGLGKMQNWLSEVAWELSEKLCAATAALWVPNFMWCWEICFHCHFIVTNWRWEKTPAHSSEHPKCLSSAEWSIFTQSLAQMCPCWILGFTWGSQSSPVGAELLSGTEAMWLLLIKWIKDHRAGFKLLFLIYFFSFLVCIVWMMEWIRHIFSFTNGDHTLHKIILKLFSRNER